MNVSDPSANQGRYGGEQVTFTRRFFGDSLLEGVLFVCTLFVGWFIWLAIVAPHGQTPAKTLLKVYVYDTRTGGVASAGQVWMREVVAKYLIPFGIALAISVTSSITWTTANSLSDLYTLLACIILLLNAERRTIWDFIASTVVRYHPLGLNAVAVQAGGSRPEGRLQELELRRTRGEVTDSEYEDKRREILTSL